MKANRNILNLLIAFVIFGSISGCREVLNEKSDLKLATAATVEANQALLDMYGVFNTEFASAGETSADDCYMTDADLDGLNYEEERNLYMWMPENVISSSRSSWNLLYKAVSYSNTVLYNLDLYNLTGKKADEVRGQALALRGIRYLDGAQIWCPAYNKNSAAKDLGLPIRLDPDFNTPSVRSTVEETYNQILSDLLSAIPLLPNQQIAKTRISKTAAYGYLARTYLFMGNYEKSLDFSLKALELQNELMNFNTLDPDADFTIPDFNEEITFWGAMQLEYTLYPAKINRELYNMYSENDLRKDVLFKESLDNIVLFTGSYNNINSQHVGVAVDELYLIVAESYARLGNVAEGMKMLNKLLVTRWKSGTFVNMTASNQQEALRIISEERRKELVVRGLRWPDLKRYNRDGANITLRRTVKGQEYVLKPNDLRYAIALPADVITISGMQQNPR